MARGGINKALVAKTRETVLARGENPSIDAIRIELHRLQTDPSLSQRAGGRGVDATR